MPRWVTWLPGFPRSAPHWLAVAPVSASWSDNLNRTRTYLDIRRFDLSAGVGAQSYRVLLIFNDKAVMEAFRTGRWQRSAGAEAVAGSVGGSSVAGQADGFSYHLLSEGGVVAGVNLRLIRLSINHDLTDTGISEITIPNRGFDTPDSHDDTAPRQWNRRLPFLAQNVIDAGYDLPLPLGTGLSYAYTDQEQLLDDLEIGLNGSEITPINFVTFDFAGLEERLRAVQARCLAAAVHERVCHGRPGHRFRRCGLHPGW